MAKRQTATAPWQDLEKQAYHAYREWPVWLVFRERTLSERGRVGRSDTRPPNAAAVGENPEHKTTPKGELV